MKRIRSLLHANLPFFTGYLLFFFTGLLFLLLTSKADSFLILTAFHAFWLDQFFIIYTNVGDGLFSIFIVLVLLLLRRFNAAWQVLASYAISGILSQVLKNLIFSPRPKEYFKFREHIYLIEGVTNTGSSSFPSGHTTSAFALAAMAALLSKDKKLSVLYLIPAILVGYSRIYLAQHFLLDVLTGSLLGVATSIFVYDIYKRKFEGIRTRKKLQKAGS